ncbi:hypothetical protein AB2L27_04565 [Kineococcus sp. LSe6-4]|uniref:Uncharacterized protein n=1 Tax=Kineococcus halophytocola TaxID=3234027 RepID=A0ABV4GXI0_9ACTN
MLIDCDSCTARPLACSECVVSVLLGPPQVRALDAEEVGAVEVLAASGLVPPLRLRTAPPVARVVGLPTERPGDRQAG